MANDLIQNLLNADIDAIAFSEWWLADAGTTIDRRLAPSVNSFQYFVDYINNLTKGKDGVDAAITSMTVATGAAGTAASVVTGGTPTARTFALTIPRGDKGIDGSFSQKAYTTYVAMDADKVNIPANTSVTVTNDTDTTKNGMYAYDGTVFTKSVYDPVTLAKADATIKANEAKTQAVEESKEYTDAKTENIKNEILVTDIKDEVELTPTFTINSYWDGTGSKKVYSNVKRTELLPINTLDDMYVSRNNGGFNDFSIVFFDESEVFISAHSTIPNDVLTKLSIPTNARFVGISVSTLYPVTIIRGNKVDGVAIYGLNNDILGINKELSTISGGVKKSNILLSNKGYYWDAPTGSMIGSPSFDASDKVPINKDTKLIINGQFNTAPGSNIVFFDDSDNVLASDFVKKDTTYVDFYVPIPLGAKWVAISTSGGYVFTAVLIGNLLDSFNDINNTYVDTKKSAISSIKNARSTNFYELGKNYTEIKARRAIESYGILFAGQSNMNGEAAYSDLSVYGLPTTLDVNNWNGASFTPTQTVASGTLWGVWWSLLKRLKDVKPSTPIYSYKLAYGASTLATEWNATIDAPVFNEFVTNIHKINALEVVNFKAVVWWQGESDQISPKQEAYEQRLKDFINAVRGAIKDPLVPFIVVGTHKVITSWYSQIVRDAQVRASIDMPNVYFINPDDLPYTADVGQGGHYNGAFFELIAPRIMDVLSLL